MADLSIPGVGESKYQSEKRIEELVKVEARKLDVLERKRQEKVERREAWQRVNRLTQKLERAAYKLYSLDNPFQTKQLISTHPEFVAGEAQRGTAEGRHRIEVEALASAQSLQSAPLSPGVDVPAGNYVFGVGEREIRLDFEGGTLADFVAKLNAEGRDTLLARLLDLGSGEQALSLSSLISGAKQRISFSEDAASLAKELGLVGEPAPLSVALPEAKGILTLAPGEQRSVNLNASYTLYPGAVLRYTVLPGEGQNTTAEGMAAGDLRRSYGPSLSPVSYQDVTLLNLEGSEALKRIRLPSVDDGLPAEEEGEGGDIAALSQDGQTVSLSRIDRMPGEYASRLAESGLVRPLGPVASLLISNRSPQALRLTQLRFDSEEDPTGTTVLHPLKPAANARFKYNDVEMERASNQIADLIPGVSLSLKEVSPGTVVELNLEPDYQNISHDVIQLIQSYNDLMTEINIVTSLNSVVIDEKIHFSEEERQQAEQRLGTLQGSMEINRLRDYLRRVSTVPYQTREGELPLARIGISTNAAGVSIVLNKSNLRGYLEIDTEKFTEALEENEGLVRDVFGFDGDGDLAIDQGLAYTLRTISYEHIRTGGAIRQRLQSLEQGIKTTDKEIVDYREHLDEYRKKLRRKFTLMEGALNQLEELKQDLDNVTPRLNR